MDVNIENQLTMIGSDIGSYIRFKTMSSDILGIEANYALRQESEFPTGHSIPKHVVERLSYLFVAIIAELIQEYIDAGSEREVTFENEELWLALESEFKGWVNKEDEQS